jgi:hypothetical protein
MSDLDTVKQLLARAQRLAATPAPPVASSRLPGDETATALHNYRAITTMAYEALEALRAPEGQVPEQAVMAAQRLLAITRLCVEEHTRICREDEARRERTRRWSEVHEEFEAAQREGRPMRSNWSWERLGTWHGDLPDLS